MKNDSALSFRRHGFTDVVDATKDFMDNQDVLTDYDLTGTVLDQIISVLAETTQKNALTANAMFAELIAIDTAYQRKNITMHARHFGYTPFSINAAKAVVSIVVVADLAASPPSQLTINKGTVVKGTSEDGDIDFVTVRSYVADLVVDTYTFSSVDVHQGNYGSVDIFIDNNRRSPLYELKVDDIDTSFLEVYVQDNIDALDYHEWTRSTDSINVIGSDEVYFLQETNNGRFSIQFGDGVIGKAVPDKTIVRVVYMKTAGEAANGIKEFAFGYASNEYNLLNTNSYGTTVTTLEKAAGGFIAESDASVKRNAPKFYVAQNRGVLGSDYENLIRIKFPYINAISVWSGKKGDGVLDQFGRIYISANTTKSQYLSESQKDEIYDSVIEDIGIAGVIPVIVDVDNTYIDISSTIYVDDFVFLTSSEIEELSIDYAASYNTDNLSTFAGKFEHSQFVGGIDDLNSVISSNITTISLQKRIFPALAQTTSFAFTFHNAITSLYSDSFVFGDNLKTVILRADNTGSINIYEATGGNEVLVKSGAGVVDFNTGAITITDIVIFKSNEVTKDLRFHATPLEPNVNSIKQNILVIDSFEPKLVRKS